MGAIDFTTFEVGTRGGLVTYYLLSVIEIATRRVHKLGRLLRIETVINQPREFKVRRCRRRQDRRQMVWCPMNKGIANFYQFHAVAVAANTRYLEALSVVADPKVAYQQIRRLAESRRVNGRSYAGFNPAREEDIRLFAAVLCG